MTEEKRNIREFWDYRSATFDRSPGHTVRSDQEEKAWKGLFSEKLTGCKDILDVGSGTGFLSLMLTELGYHVTGVDLSAQMIAQASKKAKEKGYTIDFHQGDAENLHFPDNSFDAIVNRALLWTLPHPDRAVREWMRVLRPGGRLCFFLHGPHDTSADIVQRNLVHLWTVITERRNPWNNLDDSKAGVNLPFKGGVHPDVIQSLLTDAGYDDVHAEPIRNIDELKRQHLPFMYRLVNKHGQYCYTAKKPVR